MSSGLEDPVRTADWRDSPTLLHALERAATLGEGITFVDGRLSEKHVGYDTLSAMATRVAGSLSRAGVGPGDRVCLLSSTSPELVAALFGTWRAGAVAIVSPLPRTAGDAAWRRGIELRVRVSGAVALVTSEASEALTHDLDLPASVHRLGLEGLFRGSGPAPPALPAAEALAYLQFTSGSTGDSRAVPLTHAKLTANIYGVGDAMRMAEGDVVVSWLPLFHDMGLIWMCGAITGGVRLVLMAPEQFLWTPGAWMDAVSHYGAAAIAGPSSGYELAARDLERRPRALDLSTLRVAVNGAEPVDPEVVDRFIAAGRQYGLSPSAMCPGYGLAEATLGVSISDPGEPVRIVDVASEALADGVVREPLAGEPRRRLAVCGSPPQGTEVRILAEDGAPAGAGRVGEVAVRGPAVMEGYWGVAEDEQPIRDGWLHTGDLGFLTERGEVVVCGRIKDMIVVGGRNLYPEEYEYIADRVDGVRPGSVIAFSVPDEERMVVVAEVRRNAEGAQAVADALMRELATQTTHAPSEVLCVRRGSLPKTSSGKRQRRRCRELHVRGELPVLARAALR